jgi:2-haloalkanoic acid dehalogenase type II
VTFDGIGSLLDSSGVLNGMAGQVARERRQEFLRAYADMEGLARQRRPHVPYKDVIVTALRHAAGYAGVRFARRDEQDVLASWRRIRPHDDVPPLLAELRARGYKLAALADCDDDQFELAHRALGTPLDLFLTAERLRVYTPSPLPFRAFQMITGAASRDWVHVGSNWDRDLAPAAQLGVTTIWLDRSGAGEAPASIRVRSGLEALRAIERCFAPAEACAI